MSARLKSPRAQTDLYVYLLGLSTKGNWASIKSMFSGC
jgi:hypothetical protein